MQRKGKTRTLGFSPAKLVLVLLLGWCWAVEDCQGSAGVTLRNLLDWCTFEGDGTIMDCTNSPNKTLIEGSSLQSVGESESFTPLELERLQGVRQVKLEQLKLKRAIPSPFFSFFENLVELLLGKNDFTGELPSDIFSSTMERLQVLDVQANRIRGTLPSEIGTLQALKQLWVNDNKLMTGSIPETITSLTGLTHFQIFDNKFSGTLPSLIGRLSSLISLAIRENQLQGTLPESLINCLNMTNLNAFSNKLSGPLPSAMDFPQLVHLNLGGNGKMNGTLPASIGRMSNLQTLSLHENQFSGTVPTSFSNLVSLTSATLYKNNFEGPFFNTSRLTNLDTLRLVDNESKFNKWNFTITKQLQGLSSLEFLEIGGPSVRWGLNETSSADAFFGSLASKMKRFEVSGVPVEQGYSIELWRQLGSLGKLTYLRLPGCSLQAFPSDIGRLSELTYLNLDKNDVRSPIPPEIENLTKLRSFLLRNSGLTGTVPSEVGGMARLSSFRVYANQLHGPLPPELGNTDLQALQIARNTFTGSIPANVFKNSLNQLDISNNKFSGKVPKELVEFGSKLRGLNLFQNQFTGFETPLDWRSQLTSLNSVNLGNNKWHCDCYLLRWFTSFAFSSFNTPVVQDQGNVLCETAVIPELIGKGIATIPLSSSSPIPCVMDVKKSVSITSPSSRSLHITLNTVVETFANDTFTGDPGFPGCWQDSCASLQGTLSESETELDPPSFDAYEVEYVKQSNSTQKTLMCCTAFEIFANGSTVETIAGFPLEPFTKYEFRIRKVNIDMYYAEEPPSYLGRANNALWSEAIISETLQDIPDGPPMDVVIDEWDSTRLQLRWLPPKTPNGVIRGYDLQLFTSNTSTTPNRTLSVPGVQTQESFRGLDVNVTYWARVRARTAVGPGPYSKLVSQTTVPSCEAGKYINARINNTCIECPLNTYRGVYDSECKECPARFPVTLSTGTTSEKGCVASSGFYRFNETTVKDCDNAKIDCTIAGQTLETLRIRDGFWRPSNVSEEIIECPNTDFCTKPNSTRKDDARKLQTGNSSSSDTGNRGPYCAENHIGALCMNCVPGYVLTPIGCRQCSESERSADRVKLGVVIGFGVLIVVCACFALLWVPLKRKLHGDSFQLMKRLRKKKAANSVEETPSSSQEEGKSKSTLSWSLVLGLAWDSLLVKARISIGFFQVFYAFVRAFTIPPFTEFLNNSGKVVIAFVDIDVAKVFDLIDVSCAVDLTHYEKLLVYTLVPIVIAMVIVGCFMLILFVYRKEMDAGLQKEMRDLMNGQLLFLSFLVYPGVSQKVFQTFLCDEFDTADGVDVPKRALRVDYRLDCDSSTHQAYVAYASVMVVVYPIGVLATYSVLLFTKRAEFRVKKFEKIAHEKVRHIDFLYRPYIPRAYWFEAYELVRKMVLASLTVFVYEAVDFAPGAGIMTANTVLVVAIAFLLVVNPYRMVSDHILALVSLVLLVVVTSVGMYAAIGLQDSTPALTFALVWHCITLFACIVYDVRRGIIMHVQNLAVKYMAKGDDASNAGNHEAAARYYEKALVHTNESVKLQSSISSRLRWSQQQQHQDKNQDPGLGTTTASVEQQGTVKLENEIFQQNYDQISSFDQGGADDTDHGNGSFDQGGPGNGTTSVNLV